MMKTEARLSIIHRQTLQGVCVAALFSLPGGGNGPQEAASAQTFPRQKLGRVPAEPDQLAAATGSWHCLGRERMGNLPDWF